MQKGSRLAPRPRKGASGLVLLSAPLGGGFWNSLGFDAPFLCAVETQANTNPHAVTKILEKAVSGPGAAHAGLHRSGMNTSQFK